MNFIGLTFYTILIILFFTTSNKLAQEIVGIKKNVIKTHIIILTISLTLIILTLVIFKFVIKMEIPLFFISGIILMTTVLLQVIKQILEGTKNPKEKENE